MVAPMRFLLLGMSFRVVDVGEEESFGDGGLADQNVVDAEAGVFAVLCPREAEATGGVGLGVAVDEKRIQAFEG